jgi:hypothetical protein
MKDSSNNNYNLAIIALVAALVLLGVIAVTLVTIPLQQQQQAYGAAQTFTEVFKRPIDTTLFVPCAAAGEGEEVHLTGTVHGVFHITLDGADDDDDGHVIVNIAQEMSGTGLTTGDKYHGKGTSHFEVNIKVGAETTSVSTINIIGQGGHGNNFLAHTTLHATVNPNGTVTAVVVNESVECK